MDTRMMVNLAAAFVPLFVGAIWYSPLLGKAWTNAAGIPQEPMPVWRTALIFIVTYIACYYIAGSMGPITIHQWGLHGMLANQPDFDKPGTELNNTVTGLMAKYGSEFRTFKHGAFHGYRTGLRLIFPIILIIGLFKKKKAAWIAIHSIYWIICLALMGGIVCAYMPIP